MKRHLPLLITLLFCTPAAAANITEIAGAGIDGCDSPASEAIAKRYRAYVQACVGKSACTVQPTAAVPKEEMEQAHCTGFFLKVKCGNTQISTRGGHFTGIVTVKCM